MTDEEMNLMAYELKQIVDPDLVLFAEKDGEPIGFALGGAGHQPGVQGRLSRSLREPRTSRRQS